MSATMPTRSDRRLLIRLVVAIAVPVVLYLGISLWFSWASHRAIRETGEAMLAAPFECPARTQLRVARWSKLGWSRTCEREGVDHGPWEAWQDGKLQVAGHYRDGIEVGSWTWFDDDGGIFQVIEKGQAEDGMESAPSISP